MTTEPERLVRAACYFIACCAIGIATGVTGEALTEPIVRPGHLGRPSWLALTALCFVVVTVGYWWIWPMGTFTLDRKRHVPSVLVFGFVWALADAQLFLVIDDLAGRAVDRHVVRVLVGLLAVATFQGLWHALYWDRHVAPEHNDPAWNVRKVLLCHVPNLLVTLTHLSIYREPVVFVGFQAVALIGSAWHLRFPDVRTPLTARTEPV